MLPIGKRIDNVRNKKRFSPSCNFFLLRMCVVRQTRLKILYYSCTQVVHVQSYDHLAFTYVLHGQQLFLRLIFDNGNLIVKIVSLSHSSKPVSRNILHFSVNKMSRKSYLVKFDVLLLLSVSQSLLFTCHRCFVSSFQV